MKILKTSALAAVLALGSLSANASYSRTEVISLNFDTASQIAVTLGHTTIGFADLVPGDTYNGEIDVSITGDANHTLECHIGLTGETPQAMTANVDEDIVINVDPTPANANSGDEYVLTTLEVEIDDCGTMAGNKLEFDGTINAAALENTSTAITLDFTVSYGASVDVLGQNS